MKIKYEYLKAQFKAAGLLKPLVVGSNSTLASVSVALVSAVSAVFMVSGMSVASQSSTSISSSAWALLKLDLAPMLVPAV
jgi:hypothetical protein